MKGKNVSHIGQKYILFFLFQIRVELFPNFGPRGTRSCFLSCIFLYPLWSLMMIRVRFAHAVKHGKHAGQFYPITRVRKHLHRIKVCPNLKPMG